MPRPDVSEMRRAQILEAARRLFATRPFAEVTIQEIAQVAGLSVGGVYWYYSSKDAIVVAILQEEARSLGDRMEALASTPGSARSRLEMLLTYVLEVDETLAGLYLTGTKFYAMTSTDPEIRAAIQSIGAIYRQGLQTLVRQGIEQGEFRAIPAEQVAEALLSLYEGAMLLRSLDPQNVQAMEALRTGALLMLEGLSQT